MAQSAPPPDPRTSGPAVNMAWLLGQLDKVRDTSTGWMACCPAHDDRNPSLSMQVTTDGVILLHCFRGCDTEDVCEALGIKVSDLFPDRSEESRPPRTPSTNSTPLSSIRRALFDDPQPTTGASGPARQELPGTGGLLHRGLASLFFAPRGQGKSISALITGIGAAVAGERVYYFDRENGAAVTLERAEGILEANEWPDVLDDLRFVGRHYPQLSRDWDPEDYGEAVFGRGFGLVIYDSLREAISQLGGDPNLDADISRFVDIAVTPLVRRGATVLILDNTGHEAKHRPKGSGSKLDAIPQAYKVKATEQFSVVQTGRIELTCTRSRFGDVGRRWTARIGGGVYDLPAARQIREKREEFRRACLKALAEQAPLGRDNLIEAARECGASGRTARLRNWLVELSADPSSGVDSGPDGYSPTPGPTKAGHPGATPPEAPLAPTPPIRGRGPGLAPVKRATPEPPEPDPLFGDIDPDPMVPPPREGTS
jgi:hypothetical protein